MVNADGGPVHGSARHVQKRPPSCCRFVFKGVTSSEIGLGSD